MPAPDTKDLYKFPSLVTKIFLSKRTISSSIGRRIMSDRLRRLGDIAPNGQPIEFARVFLIKKGDKVPKAFLDLEGLKVDRNGTAQAAYTDAWCESHWNESSDIQTRTQPAWGDTWGECWDNSTIDLSRLKTSQLVVENLKTGVKAFTLDEFTSQELEALSQFRIKT